MDYLDWRYEMKAMVRKNKKGQLYVQLAGRVLRPDAPPRHPQARSFQPRGKAPVGSTLHDGDIVSVSRSPLGGDMYMLSRVSDMGEGDRSVLVEHWFSYLDEA